LIGVGSRWQHGSSSIAKAAKGVAGRNGPPRLFYRPFRGKLANLARVMQAGSKIGSGRLRLSGARKAPTGAFFCPLAKELAVRRVSSWKRAGSLIGISCRLIIDRQWVRIPPGPPFAVPENDPPPEIALAGHDRCVIPIKPENIDVWLNPDPSKNSGKVDLSGIGTNGRRCNVVPLSTLTFCDRDW
jgi:hypothetical protein